MTRHNVLFFVTLSILLLVQKSGAHHGFGGEYNRSTPIYLEGFVTSAYFGYPHAELTLAVNKQTQRAVLPESANEFLSGLTFWYDALGETPEVEFPPVRRFFSLEGKIEKGDAVKLIVLRNCEPPHQLRVQWVMMANGEQVKRSGRMQNEVEDCH